MIHTKSDGEFMIVLKCKKSRQYITKIVIEADGPEGTKGETHTSPITRDAMTFGSYDAAQAFKAFMGIFTGTPVEVCSVILVSVDASKEVTA